MTRWLFVTCLAWLAACGGTASAPAPAPAPAPSRAAADTTLYRRLGGYDAIAAVVDDFLGRWLRDSTIAPFFDPVGDEGKTRIRQLVVDELCAATGGPCVYIGLDMRTAHQELGLTDYEWNAAFQHILATLDHFRVPTRERNDLIALLRSLHDDIVTGSGER